MPLKKVPSHSLVRWGYWGNCTVRKLGRRMQQSWSTIGNYTQLLIDWAEKHAGLGGWVGEIGDIIAIFVTWGLARAEYSRAQRLEDNRVNAEISLFMRITSEYQPFVQDYLKLVDAHERAAIDYRAKQDNDVRWLRLVDINWMPITQWPSVESYDAFKQYFSTSQKVLETAPTDDLRPIMEARRKSYEGTFEALQRALNAARR